MEQGKLTHDKLKEMLAGHPGAWRALAIDDDEPIWPNTALTFEPDGTACFTDGVTTLWWEEGRWVWCRKGEDMLQKRAELAAQDDAADVEIVD